MRDRTLLLSLIQERPESNHQILFQAKKIFCDYCYITACGSSGSFQMYSVCIRNQSSEDRTSVVSLAFWLVLPFRERRILYGSSKKNIYNFVVFIYFNTSNYVVILVSLSAWLSLPCQTKSVPLPVGFCQNVKDNEDTQRILHGGAKV